MSLIHYNPNNLFDVADQLFNGFIPGVTRQNGVVAKGFQPQVDIQDSENAVTLTAELPGINKDDVKVELENRVLTISGEKARGGEEESAGFYRNERSYGAFKRSFTLPDEVDPEKLEAGFENGVLTLVLAKRPEAKPRTIEIQDGPASIKQIDVK